MSLKNQELIRTLKFTLFSISAGIVEAVSFAILNETCDLPYWPCYLVALLLSVIWNFTLNRNFTFRSSGNIPVAMLKVGLFYAVFTPLSTWGGNYLAEGLFWNEYLVTGICMLANFILEYLYDRFVVFGASIDTRERKRDDAP